MAKDEVGMKLHEYIKIQRASWGGQKSKTVRKYVSPDWVQIEELLQATPLGSGEIAKRLDWDKERVHSILQRMRSAGKVERIAYWKIKE